MRDLVPYGYGLIIPKPSLDSKGFKALRNAMTFPYLFDSFAAMKAPGTPEEAADKQLQRKAQASEEEKEDEPPAPAKADEGLNAHWAQQRSPDTSSRKKKRQPPKPTETRYETPAAAPRQKKQRDEPEPRAKTVGFLKDLEDDESVVEEVDRPFEPSLKPSGRSSRRNTSDWTLPVDVLPGLRDELGRPHDEGLPSPAGPGIPRKGNQSVRSKRA